MKVIIAGSRDFADLVLLFEKCDYYLSKQKVEAIVSGAARGADKLGEEYAHLRGYAIKQFPADWDGKGKMAGYVRNCEMAEYADALIAFWDGKSKGTGHMINIMNGHGKPVRVVRFDKDENSEE